MAEHTLEPTAGASNEGSKPPIISEGNQASEATALHELVIAWLNQAYLRLDYYGDELSINVDDFLHILATSGTSSNRSWLSDDQIILPMILQLGQGSKRSDMVIVTPSAATKLAAIGLGLNDRADFESAAPDPYKAMTDGDIRWIVIPCNDGMVKMLEALSKYEEAHKRAKAEKKAVQDQAAERLRNERDKNEALKHTGAASSTTAAQQAEEKHTEHNDIPATTAKGADDGQQPRDETSKASRRGLAEHGSHWGMMIIDKEKGDARFFDGDLQLAMERLDGKRLRFRRRSKWPGTAIAAGKILCGYDKVVRRTPGQFKTGTLRHTPHDHEHNNFEGDEGSACAPWTFAMFRYILQNPNFLSSENGLKGTFRKDLRDQHIQDLAFDSRTVRRDMQSLISEQARKQEAASSLPHRLDTEILQNLGAITPDVLLFHLHNLEGRNIRKLPRKGRRSSDGRKNTGNDDDDDDDDGKFYKNVLRADLTLYMSDDANVSKEDRLEQAYNIYLEAQKGELDEHLDKRSGSGYEASNQGSNDTVGHAARYAAVQNSAAFKAIANHVIIFNPMDQHLVEQWLERNSGQDYFPSDISPFEKRARLQKAFGGVNGSTVSKHAAADYRHHLDLDSGLGHMQIIDTLRHLTKDVPNLRGQAERYPDYYLREHGVLAPGEKKGDDAPNSTPRERGQPSSAKLPASHGSEKAGRLGGDHSDDNKRDGSTENDSDRDPPEGRGGKLPFPPPSNPTDETSHDGDDDDDDDEDNDTSSKQKRRRKTGAQGNGGYPDLELPVTHNGATGEEPLSDPVGTSAGERPQGLSDFRTMSEQDLEQFKDPKWLQDERLRGFNVNTISWRAFHFVHSSYQNFTEESDANCLDLWLNDTVVFDRGERDTIRSQGRTQEIRDRMNTHYRTGPQTQRPGEMEGSDTEKDSGGDEGGNKPDDTTGDTSGTAGKRKRDPMGDEEKSNKRKKTDEAGTSDTKKERAGQDVSRRNKGDFRPTLTADMDQMGSVTPDGGDSSSSSSLSSLPSSEDELEITGGAGSGKQVDAVDSGVKRRRDVNRSEVSDQGNPSKKPKMSHPGPSKGMHGGSDDRGHVTTAPSTLIPSGESPSDDHATTSFDTDATVEVPTVDIRIGQLLYTIPNDDPGVFLPVDTTQNGWPSGATSLPNFATMGFSIWNDWFLANGAIINPLLQQRGPEHDIITSRALLHMHFRRTFVHEPDENFSNVWINDRTVFNAAAQQELLAITDSGLRNGEIRRRMMEAYEPEMLHRIETTGTYRPGRPNVLVVNVIGASSSALPEERPVRDETLLGPSSARRARSASEEGRSEDGIMGPRRSSRRKIAKKKYEG